VLLLAQRGWINVIVRNGEVVEQVTGTNVPIPPDGYVIHLGELKYASRTASKWARDFHTVTFMMYATAQILRCGRKVLFGELSVLARAYNKWRDNVGSSV